MTRLWRASLILAGLAAGRLGAQPLAEDREIARLSVHFESGSSRLTEGDETVWQSLAGRGAAGRLMLCVAVPKDPMRARFIAARAAEIDRRLTSLGLAADRRLVNEADLDPDALSILVVETVPTTAPAPLPPVDRVVDLMPPPADRIWPAEAGQSVRQILQDWSSEAGWTVIWHSSVDYPVQAAAHFSGDFPDAAASLLRAFAPISPPPRAHFYRGNQVLLIQ